MIPGEAAGSPSPIAAKPKEHVKRIHRDHGKSRPKNVRLERVRVSIH